MPRNGRGGRRQGTPGTPYSNRSDLRTAAMPMTRFTGQEYGQATAQEQAQRIVPVAPPPTPAPAAPSSQGIPQLPPFDRPTEFPDEPLFAGMPYGPGAGPEALAAMPGISNQTPTAADLERMRSVLPALEKIADLTDSNPEFRAFVRQLRGQVRSG